jgi:hypothetical protein
VDNKKSGNEVGKGKRAFGLVAFDDTGQMIDTKYERQK